MVAPKLAVRRLHKRFGGVHALAGVDLDLFGGEVHALLGENGAGKSTLVKILGGHHTPDSGMILRKSTPVEFADVGDSRAAGVGVVYQEPSTFPDLSVTENVFAGQLLTTPWGRVDWPSMHDRVNDVLASLGHRVDPRRLIGDMSIAEQQLVEIAKALVNQSEILILDEPTAAISQREARRLFDLLDGVRADGTAVLLITHKLGEVFDVADRITVFRDGAYVATSTPDEVTRADLIRQMVGRTVDNLYPRIETERGGVVLAVRNLASPGRFEGVSFQAHAGEIVGFAGLMGAGRTDIARAIFGADPEATGQIEVDGRAVAPADTRTAANAGIAYVPEDRRRLGAILDWSLRDNIALPQRRSITRLGLVDETKVEKLADDLAMRLQVKGSPTQTVGTLSGGNQQKVVLAKWIGTDPRVLILDEPTRGIDVGTKAEVHRIVSELASTGIAVLLISSELEEVVAMSDRILVVAGGRIVRSFNRGEFDHETLMAAAFGEVA